MIENLVINKNRILVGFFLILFISILYYLKLDLIFSILITIIIFYEIYKSGLLNLKGLIILIIAYTIFFFIYFYIYNVDYSLTFLITVVFFFSLFYTKYIRIFFSLFLCFLSLIIFNLFNQSREIVYFIIMLSFLNDTSAYIFGNILKGPTILPNISPKKTWTGTLGSFLMSFSILLFFDYSLFISLFLSILLFFGDIYFSYVKRKLTIKDFSNTLSSHGGFLDRLDSMSFLFIIFASFNLL